jgi:hypothetical protein
MGNINRVPLGLLSLLDSQTQGQAPATMLETVQSTYDMSALWLNARGLESIQATAVAQIASGQANLSINVPEGELWAVISASARAYPTDVAAVPCTVDLTFFPSQQTGVNTITLAGSTAVRSIAIGAIQSAVWNWNGSTPLYVRAGGRFGCFITYQFAPALGFLPEAAVLFYRLKI